MSLQLIATYIIIAYAITYTIIQSIKMLKPKTTGCTGCSSCDIKKQIKQNTCSN